MPFTLIIEIVLSGLLAATVAYCAVLERRLSALRKGQDGLKQTIGDLNAAIATASTSMRLLKDAAGEAAESLDAGVGRARALADELAVLVSSGERIVGRLDRLPGHPAHALPASLASRLAARPQIQGTLR